jgi:uncharacterized membrane protein YgcG
MTRIVDDAGVLTPAERERLATTATWSEAELIVHLVPSVVKRAFRQHAMAVRRQLSQHYERSVVVVLAVADRHLEIATAKGYAGLFDAAACNALLLQHAVPAMREGRTADALAATLEELARRLAAAPLPLPDAPRYDPGRPGRGTIVILILFLVLFLTAIAASIFGHPRGGGTDGSSDSSWSSDSGGSDSGSSDSGSFDSGGSDGGGGADY